MAETIDIRLATAADYGILADIMFAAVRCGRSAYSEQQRQAWVPEKRGGPEWDERLGAQVIFVAADASRSVGFMSLGANGYIDFAYVRPSSQGQGVFRRLYEAIERLAACNNEPRLWVHASLMARDPFAAMGFTVTREEVVEIRGQPLKRFEMEKRLSLETNVDSVEA
ncbi:MAG: GNAT family N-acetyltransferase [Pirellulaceae bacterium]